MRRLLARAGATGMPTQGITLSPSGKISCVAEVDHLCLLSLMREADTRKHSSYSAAF